jgi:ribosomal RNA-processing protein 36
MEASSKRRPPRFIDFGTIPRNTQRKSRDPRFDSLSGKFNEDLFQKSYSFVEDYKQEELNELNEQLRKEKDPEEKERLALGVRLLVRPHTHAHTRTRDTTRTRHAQPHTHTNEIATNRNSATNLR